MIAYIDLNPLRAGLVDRPEDYRWNSLGYHLQTQNKDQFLSTDFGFKEFNVKSPKERIRRYRRYVYEAGAINRPDKMEARVIDDKVVAKKRKKEFEISRISRFRYRTRYFTDSGIIGSKEFVSENYQRFKHLFVARSCAFARAADADFSHRSNGFQSRANPKQIWQAGLSF